MGAGLRVDFLLRTEDLLEAEEPEKQLHLETKGQPWGVRVCA